MSDEDAINRGVAFADKLTKALAYEINGEVGPVERFMFVTGFLSTMVGMCGGAIGAGAMRAVLEKNQECIDKLQGEGRIE